MVNPNLIIDFCYFRAVSSTTVSAIFCTKMSTPKKYCFLDELNGNFTMGSVRIRVLQKSCPPGSTVDMVVTDQKGTTMNVKIMNTHARKFVDSLKEKLIYDITRFSTPKATGWNRPTKHDRVMFLNTNTTVDHIQDIAGFPTRRAMDYIKLDEAMDIAERQDNTYLHDIVGVVVYVSTVNAYSVDKLKRVIGIQDNTGTTIKIVLWDGYAADFDQLEIAEKSVLALASIAVNMKKGFDAENFMTGKFTQLLVDSNSPIAIALKKSDNYADLEEGVQLADWRIKNRKTLTAIISEFDPDDNEEPYTCVAEIIGHGGIIPYLACKNCNTKFSEDSSSFYCKKCNLHTAAHTYCRMETTISDKTTDEAVTLFGNQLETIFKMKLPKILALTSDTTKSGEFYKQMFGKRFVFELKGQVYLGGLNFSIYRIGEDVNSEQVLANAKGKLKITAVTNEQAQPSTPDKTTLGKRRQATSTKGTGSSSRISKKNSSTTTVQSNSNDAVVDEDPNDTV